MIRLQFAALVENIPLNLKNGMRRAEKCLSPMPACQVM